MSEAGRPRKLTDACLEAICESISRGCTKAAAAEAAGIHRDTLHDWETKFPDVSDAIKKAEGELIKSAVDVIFEEGRKGNWTAMAWLLERRHAKDFGRKAILSGDSEGPPVVFRLDLSDKQEGTDHE